MPREKINYRRNLLAVSSELAEESVDKNLKKVNDAFLNDKGIMLPLRAVAEWLGVTEKVLKRDNFFPVRMVGRRYYVTRVDLARWMS